MRKEAKRHHWVGLVSIELTEEDVKQMKENGGRLNKPYHNKEQRIELGCFDCELPVGMAYGTPCKGKRTEIN